MQDPKRNQCLKLTLTSPALAPDALMLAPRAYIESSLLGGPSQKVGDAVLHRSREGEHELLISLGPIERLSAEAFRKAGKAAAKWMIEHRIAAAAIDPTEYRAFKIEAAMQAFCEGLLIGGFQFRRLKSNDGEPYEGAVYILDNGSEKHLEEQVARVDAIMAGVDLTRSLAHEPPNIINPVTLAEYARQMADEDGLKCTVLGPDELEAMGAGAILSVGLGSKTPSQMIILEYPGNEDNSGAAPIVLVGKAITFDTGGYTLKPLLGMDGMKFDKCGGATVLGVMHAIAALKPTMPVIGMIAAAENMISENAYRTNDIIETLSGITVEVISTDAEGRMVLSDTLTYAQREFKPRALIDIATLTGGMVVALGGIRAGLFSNDETLADNLFQAGERTHERLWRMPLDEDYFAFIRGDDSDIRNSYGKAIATPVVGAMFLKQFVEEDTPWAHLDIAGAAMVSRFHKTKPYGATGFGVRLLVEYIAGLQ